MSAECLMCGEPETKGHDCDGVNMSDEQLEAAMEKIRAWPWKDPRGLFAYLRSLWAYADWGWHEKETKRATFFHISTAGWSDNEALIGALEENRMIMFLCWVQSRRGGHYVFRIERAMFPEKETP